MQALPVTWPDEMHAEEQALHMYVSTGKADLPLNARVDTPAMASDRHNEPQARKKHQRVAVRPRPRPHDCRHPQTAIRTALAWHWSVRLRVGRWMRGPGTLAKRMDGAALARSGGNLP